MLWILLGVVAGLVVPVQTVINTRLRESTGTPFSSSMISFAVGTATLLTAVLVLQRGHFGLSAAWGAPPWIWAGGFLGVVFLTGNILLFPRLGAVQTVVLPIAGQILMGLVIDHCGLFSSPVARLTWVRLLGALLVLAGVMLTVGRPRAQEVGWGLLPWQIAGFVFGCLNSSQSAINGHLGQLAGSALSAAFASFAIGAATLLFINAVLRWRPHLDRPHGERNPWWMWLGGVLGALFVFATASLVPQIGTGLTVVVTLLGSMVGSVIVERARGENVAVRQCVGLALVLAGVVLIRLV
ncbi:DMT family transporter [Corynebacterium phoceense]